MDPENGKAWRVVLRLEMAESFGTEEWNQRFLEL